MKCGSVLQVNIARWPCNIGSPVVLVDRIFLIHIQLEKLVVRRTFVILEPKAWSALCIDVISC
jgi:hypothetical protein